MSDLVGETNLTKNSNSYEERLDKFTKTSRFFQILLASGDSVQGAYASLYAVARGSTGIIQGAIVSVRELGTAILQPLWGHLSDLIGRRQFVVIGLLIQALCWGILMPLAQNPLQILLVIIFQTTLGTMVIPTWNGWLGDFTTRSTRGKFLGRLGLLGSWFSLISLYSISAFMQFIDSDRIFVETYFIALRGAGVFYCLAALSAFFLPQIDRYDLEQQNIRREKVKTTKANQRLHPEQKPIKLSFKDRLRQLNPDFKRLLIAEAIFRLAWASAWPIFPYATLSATDGWLEIALIQIVFGFTAGLSQLFGGKWSDSFGRKKIVIGSRIVLVAPPLLFGLGVLYDDVIFLYISNILVGIMLGGSTIALNSMILDTAPEGNESSYFSFYILIVGIFSFLGSMITGFVLNILVPSDVPSSSLIVKMLFVIAGIRFIAWFVLFLLPETNAPIS